MITLPIVFTTLLTHLRTVSILDICIVLHRASHVELLDPTAELLSQPIMHTEILIWLLWRKLRGSMEKIIQSQTKALPLGVRQQRISACPAHVKEVSSLICLLCPWPYHFYEATMAGGTFLVSIAYVKASLAPFLTQSIQNNDPNEQHIFGQATGCV